MRRRGPEENVGSIGPIFWTTLDYGDDPKAPRYEVTTVNEVEGRWDDPEWEITDLRRGRGLAVRLYRGHAIAIGLWRKPRDAAGLLGALDGRVLGASPAEIKDWDDGRRARTPAPSEP